MLYATAAGSIWPAEGRSQADPNQDEQVRIVPIEEIVRTGRSDRWDYQLSPDGDRLAWLTRRNDSVVVQVSLQGGPPERSIPAPRASSFSYRWAGDSSHLLITGDTSNGNEKTHIFATRMMPSGSDFHDISPPGSTRNAIIDTIGSFVYFASDPRQPGSFDLFRVELNTERQELVAESSGDTAAWILSRSGDLLSRVRIRQNRTDVVESFNAKSAEWDSAFEFPDEEFLGMIGHPDELGRIWARSDRNRDRSALVRLDLHTGHEEVFYQEPAVDIDAVVLGANDRPLVAFSSPDYQKAHFIDAEFEALLSAVRGPEPTILSVRSSDRAGRMFVISAADERRGEQIFLADVQQQKVVALSEGAGAALSKWVSISKPIALKSRDGLTLHGYLTLPRGMDRKLPLVLMVHGGPWLRDTLGFDWLVQFLANRGYAVLRVNFRGSSGYGRSFREAAFGEFGRKMQDDLTDAVCWSIDQGIADPKAIAVLGMSYGGYAALSGLVLTPNLYAAGIELAGMTDLVTFSESLAKEWPLGVSLWRRYLGNPADPKARITMAERSPLNHVDRIQAPLLALHGSNDSRVPREQFDRLVDAMHAAGKDLEAIRLDGMGHDLSNEADRIAFLSRLEPFLARHLRNAGDPAAVAGTSREATRIDTSSTECPHPSLIPDSAPAQ
jgi:dipeptidyl aminopeptidase/acylaminoacyl peptidase